MIPRLTPPRAPGFTRPCAKSPTRLFRTNRRRGRIGMLPRAPQPAGSFTRMSRGQCSEIAEIVEYKTAGVFHVEHRGEQVICSLVSLVDLRIRHPGKGPPPRRDCPIVIAGFLRVSSSRDESISVMRRAILHLKKADPILAAIIKRVGPYRINYDEPTFASLAEAIVYQQLHGKAAATIFKRLTDLTGLPLRPEGILKLSEEQMRGVGLSKQKLSYLRDLAAKTHTGELDFVKLTDMADEEVIQHLTQIKGIGVWTAHMFLMFSLRRPDVLPTGDLGILVAVKKHYRKRTLPKPKDMERIARCWSPYRSVACWYLWRSMDIKTVSD